MIKKIIYIALISCISIVFIQKKDLNAKNIAAASGSFQPNQSNVSDGKLFYQKFCLACHQADGSGVPDRYPPLKKNSVVNGDPMHLIKIVLNGLEGEIEVNGETYDQSMPPMDHLTDQQIASILTYLRASFENNAKPVKTGEVLRLRKEKK